jgi:hypothetical protein
MRLLNSRALPLLIVSTVLSAPVLSQTKASEIKVPNGWHSERSGEDTILTPGDLRDGEVYRMAVKPPVSLDGQSLREWFESQLEADAATQGKLTNDSPIQTNAKTGILTTVRAYQGDSGTQLIALYTAFLRTDGKAQWVRITSSPQKTTYQPRLRDSMAVITGLAKGGTATTAGGRSTATDRPSTRPTPTPKKVYATKPGAGVKPSQIEGIYMNLTYQSGVGGYIYPVYEPVLFLKDGTYWDGMNIPPADLDIAASRQGEPRRWGHWKRVGNKFQLQDEKGKWDDPKEMQEAKPGASGEKLNGTFTTIGGGGNVAFGGGTMVAYVNSFTFLPNGHFKAGKFAGGSSNEPTSPVGVSTYSKSESDGTYTIDGYTLTLRFKDGRVERRAFSFMDPKDKDAIYLNGSAYLKDKKK